METQVPLRPTAIEIPLLVQRGVRPVPGLKIENRLLVAFPPYIVHPSGTVASAAGIDEPIATNAVGLPIAREARTRSANRRTFIVYSRLVVVDNRKAR